MSWHPRWNNRRVELERRQAHLLSVARHNAFMEVRIQVLFVLRGEAALEWPAPRDIRAMMTGAADLVLRHTNSYSLGLEDVCEPLITEASGLAQRLGMGSGLALDACQTRVIVAELVPQLSGRRLRA